MNPLDNYIWADEHLPTLKEAMGTDKPVDAFDADRNFILRCINPEQAEDERALSVGLL